MVSIAICDDEKDTLLKLEQMLYECFDELGNGTKCTVEQFSSGGSLIEKANDKLYDLYILDIVMPNILGIDIARKIRKTNSVSAIVFLTSSTEFAIDSYDTDALDYVLKPIKKERLLKTLSKFFIKYQLRDSEEMIIQQKNTVTKIPLHALLYTETQNRQLIYHMSDGTTIVCRQALSDAEKFLMQHKNFMKPHRSYIVNQDYISKINSGCIIMKNGDSIYASRSCMKNIADEYLKYKLEKLK